jgi:hypothetical protein
LQQLNRSGDLQGLVYENGGVKIPKGFEEAYDKFVEAA